MAKNENKPNQWGPENPHPLSRMKTELIWGVNTTSTATGGR